MTREQKAIDIMTEVLKKYADDICVYCKHEIPCPGKTCEHYIEGIGDDEGKYPSLKWSCEDFDHGTCIVLENTPCNGCFDNDYRGFVWKG
jgi:hypothetical protein